MKVIQLLKEWIRRRRQIKVYSHQDSTIYDIDDPELKNHVEEYGTNPDYLSDDLLTGLEILYGADIGDIPQGMDYIIFSRKARWEREIELEDVEDAQTRLNFFEDIDEWKQEYKA